MCATTAGAKPAPRHLDMHPADVATTPIAGVNLDEPLLTAADVAVLLAVPRSSVYEYARRQHMPLPSIGIGRHRRFYRSDLEVWLSRQRSGERR